MKLLFCKVLPLGVLGHRTQGTSSLSQKPTALYSTPHRELKYDPRKPFSSRVRASIDTILITSGRSLRVFQGLREFKHLRLRVSKFVKQWRNKCKYLLKHILSFRTSIRGATQERSLSELTILKCLCLPCLPIVISDIKQKLHFLKHCCFLI